VTIFEHAKAEVTSRIDGSETSRKNGRTARKEVSRQDLGLVAVKAIRLRSHHDVVVFFVSHRATGTPGLPGGALPLSPREREIANLVSQGLTNRKIAELTYVSENTVKQHLKRIFTKLEVNSRAELVQTMWTASTNRNDDSWDPDQDSLTELP
jgi:DNA-binding CsgD family transcriptional regulator